MGEILSHAEVEAILSGGNSSLSPTPGEVVTEVSHPDSASSVRDSTWERHDFGRPEAARDEVLSILPLLHSEFCHLLGTCLTSLVQAPVRVHPVGACSSTPRDFLRNHDSPAILCHVNDAEQQPHSLIVWQSRLARSLMNQMLGGHSGDGLVVEHRDLTEIESRLLSRLNGSFIELLRQCLRREESGGLSIRSLHCSLAGLSQELTNLAVVWVSFEVQFADSRGLVHGGLLRKLIRNARGVRTVDSRSAPGPQNVDTVSEVGSAVEVLVSAQLAKIRLRTGELAELQVGDVLMTDIPHSGTATLDLADQPLFQAEMGTADGRRAVRLTRPLGVSRAKSPMTAHPELSAIPGET
jgi:flagellar motor switch protein FliM